jgi:CRP/FNR family transcriptional regulator, cyclic AMP receptor protein
MTVRPETAGILPPGTAGFLPAGLADAADLIRRGRRRRWRKGGVLCSQEESSQWIAVLLSGVVKASVYTEDGGEVLLNLHGPGALVGELEALDGKPRPATLTALEPVEAAVISHPEFMLFMRDDSQARWLVVEALCQRLREADAFRIQYASYDTTGRVAKLLVMLAERFGQTEGQGILIPVALTQTELASWVGASREAVSAALRSLRLRGWIRTGRRRLVVCDLIALRALAS